MEPGNLANQSDSRKGQLVSAEVYELPLLPYEHDLIATLGLSEQEYREFAAEVRTKLREVDFKGQPTNDIITPILISLAVGLVLTGVSVLLAPKPKQPNQEKKQNKSIQLDSQSGRTRFNNSVGFEGAPQLAQLGSRIPMPFGQFIPGGQPGEGQEIAKQSGGIVVDPLLVWSRMTSHGKYQAIKFLTVIGTSTITKKPGLPAFMFGGQSLANFYKTNYWIGWSSKNDVNQIKLGDTLYGDAAGGLTGSEQDDIFICPTFDTNTGLGFSQVYTPANTTSFGVYDPIPNGGHWRLNWQVISFPEDTDKDIDGKIQNERKKIAGNEAKKREDGMKGIGRAYSCKCGVIGINGSNSDLPIEVDCQLGDELTYEIAPGQFTFDNAKIVEDSGVTIGDLNSRIDSIRESADELLQTGVVLVMNRTLLRVTERPGDVWNENSGSYYYKLKVIGFTGANRRIGIIGITNIIGWVLSEGGDDAGDFALSRGFKGANWYGLSKMDIGQVKNTRPVEVTEIGIRAQVYSQINGLCNFNSIPSPNDLVEYDEDNIQVNAGTTNKYARRTAFFVLGVRDPNNIQGYDPNTNEEDSISDQYLEGYDIIDNTTFAVTGTKPVDQFSFIRIRHPSRTALEFRLIPKPAQTIIRFGAPEQIQVLRGSGQLKTVFDTANAYGPFRIDFCADSVPLDQLVDLPEVNAGRQKVSEVLDCSNLTYNLLRTTPDTGGGSWQAWLESLDGGAWNLKPTSGNDRKNEYDQSRSTVITAIEVGGSRTVDLSVFGTVRFQSEERLYSHGTAKAWEAGFQLMPGEDRKLQIGDIYEATRNVRSPATHTGNWFNLPPQITQTFRVQENGECKVITPSYYTDREFEDYAAIKELSCYQEISRSCDSSPEFSIAYVNESLGCSPVPNWYGMSVIGFKVRSLNQTAAFNQAQVWLPDGIDIPRLGPSQAYGNDGRGDTGPSNNFADIAHYLLTATGAGVAAAGRSIAPELVATGWFVESARFLANYWMRFDGAISDSTNLRDYLTQIAPLFLCDFAIVNGKFALKPALPQVNGALIEGPITPAAMFTDGTIVAGSFKLTYLPQSERQDFRANMIYRLSQQNTLVEQKSILVQWDWDENSDDDPNNNITTINQEDFDMSSFCTRRSHAFAAARYMLSVRRRVDHVVEFKTTPEGVGVAPGDFIRIDSNGSPYEEFRNGVVLDDGTIRSPSPMPDGIHRVFVYLGGESDEVKEMEMEVKDGKVLDPGLFGALFNAPGIAKRFGMYQVESVGIEEDGCVKITGSHHPVFADLSSKIVYDVMHPERFRVVEEGRP